MRGEKIVASPNFITYKQFDENRVAVERKKASILMNRPIYVGFTILELSKLLMYEFHYKQVKKWYPNDQSLLIFTDTDSLTYIIKSENFIEEMKPRKEYFDCSEYKDDHPLYCLNNKKVLGKFKDELSNNPAIQFVGLKPKMYSLKTVKGESNRAKGMSTRIVRKKLCHEDYRKCLDNQTETYENQIRIGQQSHRLFTIQQNKKCLSPFDDKRYILNDGITTYAYGAF